MARFVNNYRLETAARTVWSDVQSAKMAAIKANQSVMVQKLSSTSYTYSFTDGFNQVHSFFRDLNSDGPGVTLAFDGGSPITFFGSGMASDVGVDRVVTVQNSSGTKSFLVSWTGKIGSISP